MVTTDTAAEKERMKAAFWVAAKQEYKPIRTAFPLLSLIFDSILNVEISPSRASAMISHDHPQYLESSGGK